MYVINILVGAVLLLAGRKLFWLFVAMIGFANSFHFAQQIFGLHSPFVLLVLSVVVGILGAVIAIFFQKAAILVGGFATGGYIAMGLAAQLTGLPGQTIWLPYVVGGIIGAVVLYFVFDWALIFLSSLIGAILIVQTTAFRPMVELVLFFALVIAGAVFQRKAMAGAPRTQ